MSSQSVVHATKSLHIGSMSSVLQKSRNKRPIGMIAIQLLIGTLGVAGIILSLQWFSHEIRNGSGLFAAYAQGSSLSNLAHREVTVRAGDTIWSLAQIHGPAQMDVRETVDWIRRHNDLSGVIVMPGETIIIPIAK